MKKSLRGRLILVTGGAASGKSDFAEKLAVRLNGSCGSDISDRMGSQKEMSAWLSKEKRGGDGADRCRLWYVATMHRTCGDEEIVRRIRKHREHRAGFGFETIEQERNIAAVERIVRPGDTVLIEDLSNLLANEMFPPDTDPSDERVPRDGAILRERILLPLLEMRSRGINVIAVGNRITEDITDGLDESTARYVRALSDIQKRLGTAADEVTEVVCGIPLPNGPHLSGE